jgi:hypothetical protein
MGKGLSQNQRAYREYVCSSRNKEEQEIREKRAWEPLGRQGFRSRWIRRRLRLSGPEGEGQENSLYQFDISKQYENRPQIIW